MTSALDCCPEEWRTRIDLSALYRLAVHFGWTDLTSTHISARIPGNRNHYLLNSYDLMFNEITASNLRTMSFTTGAAVSDTSTTGNIVNLAGHIIHSGILRGRPEINYVIHSHTRAGVAVSAMPNGLRPLSQHAGFVLGTLSSHPY